jgi:putative ABC transport system permease protein
MTALPPTLRSLVRTPLFTAAAVLSLALGIATATTVFSLLDAAVLRPLPFAEPDRLMMLNIVQRTPAEGEYRVRWSWPRFRMLQRSVRSFERVASNSNAVVTLTGAGDPEPLPIEFVSSDYFALYGTPIVVGRGFTVTDDEPATAEPTVVLSWSLWQERFDGAENAIGRSIVLNGVPMTVIGVAGRDFTGVSGLARAWTPATMAPRLTYDEYLTTNQNFITAVGRLRPGVSLEAARAELAAVGARIQSALPSEAETPDDTFSATAMPLAEARVDVVTRRALLLLGGAVGLLLLIACANVASLLLGRAAARRREIAIRLAIGAGRGRLVRQLLAESAALAVAAGVVGVLAAAWAIGALRIPPTLARGRNFYGAVGEFATPAMDWRVLAFAVAVCATTVILFGLVPAIRASRSDLTHDLRSGAGGAGRGARFELREGVVALQVALSVTLLVGCGLMLASFARLRQTPLGFDPSHLLTFSIRPSEVTYPVDRAPALIERMLGEIARVPGVQAATVDGCAPLATQCASAALHIVGRPWRNPLDAPAVLRHYVGPDHFRTLGMRVLRGRGLTAEDRPGGPKVVVINETAAERFWPGEDPIGRRVWFDANATFGSADSSAEIVGIVSDVAYQPLDEHPVQADFFTSFAQFTYASRMVIVRTRGEPLALTREIGRAVRRADPGLALFDVRTMEERAGLSWSKQRFQTRLLTTIAAIALVLAVTGVYAVTSWFVTSRSREIGVRIALGAGEAAVIGTSISRTVRLGALGALAGMGGAVVGSRFLRAMLYDTSPMDPLVFAGALGVLLIALLMASWVPVRRALKVDPVEVMRAE